MPDPVTAGGVVILAAGAKQILGPAAHELGQALGRATEFRLRNVGRITQKAEAKLGDKLNDPGEVPPRVAAKVLDDGSWCDDGVMQEYLAGVLAGSRNTTGGDDRGTYWADLVSRLAGDYVRMHYLLYRALRDHGAQVPGVSLSTIAGHEARSIYLPLSGLSASLGVSLVEAQEVANGAMHVLAREGLIAPTGWGVGHHVVGHMTGAEEPGVQAVPTHAGIELFLWAHAWASSGVNEIFRQISDLPEFDEHLPPVEGARVGQLL
jgi:hypothetical protein